MPPKRPRKASNTAMSSEELFLDDFVSNLTNFKSTAEPAQIQSLVNKIQDQCKNELNLLKIATTITLIKKKVVNSKYYKNPELKLYLDDLKIGFTEYERMDYHVNAHKVFSLGVLSFDRTYYGDNEGEGVYGFTLNDEDTEVLVLDREDECCYEDIDKISFSNSEGLDKLYENRGFENVTKELFLEFIVYFYCDIMGNC